MKKGLKKMIAREGLIIISLVLGGAIIALASYGYGSIADNELVRISEKYGIGFSYDENTFELITIVNGKHNVQEFTDEELSMALKANELRDRAYVFQNDGVLWGFAIPTFGYPLYLFVMFLCWATKTLKEKD